MLRVRPLGRGADDRDIGSEPAVPISVQVLTAENNPTSEAAVYHLLPAYAGLKKEDLP